MLKKTVMELKGDRQKNLRHRRSELMKKFTEYMIDHREVAEADGMSQETTALMLEAHRMMAKVCGEIERWNHSFEDRWMYPEQAENQESL